MALFGFCAAPSLIWGRGGGGGGEGGWEFAVPFYSVQESQDCNFRRVTMRMTKNELFLGTRTDSHSDILKEKV